MKPDIWIVILNGYLKIWVVVVNLTVSNHARRRLSIVLSGHHRSNFFLLEIFCLWFFDCHSLSWSFFFTPFSLVVLLYHSLFSQRFNVINDSTNLFLYFIRRLIPEVIWVKSYKKINEDTNFGIIKTFYWLL